jgi:hypothetical protein
MASSEAAPKDNHHAQMVRYLDSVSSIVLELFAEVLVLHVWLDILLYVSFQQCSLVEETSTLSVFHGDLLVTTAMDDSNSIPIHLRTVHHEDFEVGILHAVFSHEIVEFSPHDTLDLCVLRLHVTYGDCHDLAIRCIVHVIHHCGPFLDTLDMVKHEPSILETSS